MTTITFGALIALARRDAAETIPTAEYAVAQILQDRGIGLVTQTLRECCATEARAIAIASDCGRRPVVLGLDRIGLVADPREVAAERLGGGRAGRRAAGWAVDLEAYQPGGWGRIANAVQAADRERIEADHAAADVGWPGGWRSCQRPT